MSLCHPLPPSTWVWGQLGHQNSPYGPQIYTEEQSDKMAKPWLSVIVITPAPWSPSVSLMTS